MCGIIGAIGSFPEDTLLQIEGALDLMLHRGPDAAGVHVSGPAHLGFRRLAILDLSVAGNQPMVSPDGRLTLVFNGEIYNYRDLRRALEPQYAFHSQSDTEVLLHGFLAWGWDGLLRQIDGMFAIALWDAKTQVLYAARDRAGKKPFFYSKTPQGLLFASSLNALQSLRASKPEISPQALDAYLTYQAVPAPFSIFKDTFQLPAAHQLVFDLKTETLTVSRYWEVRYTNKVRQSEAEILDELDYLVRNAVRKRLVSDVPLGAFLSGGVDSSLIVALMAQEGAGPVEAVTMGFSDPSFDERPYARQVAQHWGVRLHEHELSANLISDLPDIVWQYGQPIGDVSIVPTYYVAKAAKQHVTVVLNGDGGDELFGGYARPVVVRAAQLYRQVVPQIIRQALGTSIGDLQQGPLRRAAMLAKAGHGTAIDSFTYDRAFRGFRTEAYTDAFRQSIGDWNSDALYREVWQRADAVDDTDRALYGDFSTYLPDQLLTKMDTSTMAHSLEGRSPLLDTALIEYAARLPTHLRIKGFSTKYLLKRLAERYVPREVLYRRKQGFVPPVTHWLRQELAPHVRATLLGSTFRERGWVRPEFVEKLVDEHLSGRRNWREQLWTLFTLEVWARLTIDGTLHRSDSLEALRS